MTTLSAVKAYMRDRGRAAVHDLAVGLSTTPDNARTLLEIWRTKDKVRCISGSCGPCGKGPLGCSCSMAGAAPEIYEWVGDEDKKSL